MGARVLLVVGLGLSLTGCLLPTPFSMVSMGVDAVSFVATGKAATDHGVSLAMGEDCALIRIFEGDEGEVCRSPVVYEATAAGMPLEPLPDSVDSAQLAAAHPEVRAAVERAAQFDGWASDKIQLALLPGDFVADDFDSITAPAPAAADEETSALSLGALLSSLSENLTTFGAESYREPANRADGGRMPERQFERRAIERQRAALPAGQSETPRRTGANREVGERPKVSGFGALSEVLAEELADRIPSLRQSRIDG